jgi:hypothetical protein
MAERKFEKCFNTRPKAGLKLPPYRHDYDFIRRITYIDADTVPGADFYNECMWILPDPSTKEGRVFKDAHTHTWGQYLGFYVYNYDDIHSLGAEIEFTIDGETHNITESFSAFIPAGIEHGPLIIKNVTLPIFHFAAGPCDIYS